MPTRLDNNNPYTALSYCWNDSTSSPLGNEDQCIFLEDLEALPKRFKHGTPLPRKSLPLTPNLIKALRTIRQRHAYRTAWVDQICINQADADERSAQVAIMKRIYTNAKSVMIWLGDDTPDGHVAKAFELARHLGGPGSRFYQEAGFSLGLGDYTVDVASCRKYGIPLLPEASNEYATLVSLVCRPWFSRSWIVQEVALNKNIIVSCGASEIPFQPLWVAISYCYRELGYNAGAVPQATMAAYGSLSLVFPGAANPWARGLFEVLVDHRCCLSTEARDKVFAFLSVAEAGHDLGVVADYNYCARSVFTKLAAEIIRHHPNLDILSHATPWPPRGNQGKDGIAFGTCRDKTQRCQDESHPRILPSWAPDWSTVVECRELRPMGPKKRVIVFKAAKNSTHNPKFRNYDTELGIQGFVLDQVNEVGGLFGRSLSEQWAGLKEAESMVDVHSEKFYKSTGENAFDAFLNTIAGGNAILAATCGRPSYEVTEEDAARYPTKLTREALREQYRTMVEASRLALFRDKLESKLGAGTVLCRIIDKLASRILSLRIRTKDYDVTQRFAQAILGGNTNRRIVRSKKGYVGFAGPQTKPGDCIALFAGGAVPVIIRRGAELLGSEARWKIVGDAYVHGVMFGEAFDESKCETMWIA
nr:hypothetical protein [Paramyrothecium roridum]